MISPIRQSIYALLLGVALGWATPNVAKAESPETAPAELTQVLSTIETAASAEDLDQVMTYYSPDFTHTDGFDRDSFAAALQQFWDTYNSLTYRIELQSWERDGTALIAETLTYVTGTELTGSRSTLDAVVRSRQRFENGQVVSQEILAERNAISAGNNPPSVNVLLPEEVGVGEAFEFDAIVEEPLGERLLLGAAIDEGATSVDFFEGRPVELDVLSAGGLFKIGSAPDSADDRWISAVLIREDGLVILTRRLRVR